jgi:hypothetical protein
MLVENCVGDLDFCEVRCEFCPRSLAGCARTRGERSGRSAAPQWDPHLGPLNSLVPERPTKGDLSDFSSIFFPFGCEFF